MKIWPAIDIFQGRCVRLKQGDYDQKTVYGSPVEMANHWYSLGATRLHLVDLDGAKEGQPTNFDIVADIVKSCPSLFCELGGGVRSEETIRRYLDVGVRQLVIGTLALRNPDWFAEMCRLFPYKLVLGIDAKNGMVATDGWLATSHTSSVDLAKQFDHVPLAAIVYTDIATDGMLNGPNIPEMQRMAAAVAVPVTASGGVTTVEDVRQLKMAGLPACIIGRALYEGTLSLPDALAAAKE